MNRREFLVHVTVSGVLVATLQNESEARRPRNVSRFNISGAREGESLEAFLKRKKYTIDSQVAERLGESMVTRVTKSNGNWLYGPMWTPPPSNPDQRPDIGWPGIILRVYNPRTRVWFWSEHAILSIPLAKAGKVQLLQVGYDPRIASIVRLDLGAQV